MNKTLHQRMKPDAFEKRHLTELAISENRQKVLISNMIIWSDSNVASIDYVADLLKDVSKEHDNMKEVADEINHFQMLLRNQNKQLKEIR